ncbi:DNA/RNA non-specific endonuclease [Planctomycetota bacterium]|nr:DNA/RNA non-specific endonuclease [Planctomycetota bacterium]MDB4733833.1 DNA/RNA non-specific endonuclease [Planctomycetota bacterium]
MSSTLLRASVLSALIWALGCVGPPPAETPLDGDPSVTSSAWRAAPGSLGRSLLAPENLAGGPPDQVVEHFAMRLGYCEEWEQPRWVAHKLERLGGFERTDDFRPDPSIETGSAALADYRGSGLDRGHLAPAGDFSWSSRAMSESFFLSNMSPQTPAFNRGVWRQIEAETRGLLLHAETLWIVTGPIVFGGEPAIGANEVVVPTAFFKAVLGQRGDEWFGVAYLHDNVRGNGGVDAARVSIDEVERIAQLDLFSALPPQLEEQVESQVLERSALGGRLSEPPKASPNRSKAPSSRLGVAVRCSAITQRGTRCKRRTKNATGRCWQH